MILTARSPFDLVSGKSGGSSGIVSMPTDGRNIGRDFVVPSNPATSYQVAVRNYLSASSLAFQSLTTLERAAWDALAIQITRSGRLDLPYTLSAIQTYNMVNMHRQLAGEAITDTAPTFAELPGVTISDISSSGGDVTVDIAYSGIAANNIAFVRFTPALASAQRQARQNELRFVTDSPADSKFAIDGTSPDALVMTMETFTFSAAEYVGCEVLILTSEYLPCSRTFLRSYAVT